MEFAWDPAKNRRNRRKHRVSFEEALSVFSDPLARIFDDPDHSDQESRELIVGYSHRNRLLVVCFVEKDDRTRIISARYASSNERRRHEQSAEDSKGEI
jgi:uncharacterized protein